MYINQDLKEDVWTKNVKVGDNSLQMILVAVKLDTITQKKCVNKRRTLTYGQLLTLFPLFPENSDHVFLILVSPGLAQHHAYRCLLVECVNTHSALSMYSTLCCLLWLLNFSFPQNSFGWNTEGYRINKIHIVLKENIVCCWEDSNIY